MGAGGLVPVEGELKGGGCVGGPVEVAGGRGGVQGGLYRGVQEVVGGRRADELVDRLGQEGAGDEARGVRGGGEGDDAEGVLDAVVCVSWQNIFFNSSFIVVTRNWIL